MALIPFDQWLPDMASLGNKGSTVIKNAIPGTTSYKPFPAFTVLTDPLDARARGAIRTTDKDGNVFMFAGDAAKLYQLSSTSWINVSKSGGYATGDEERWAMVRWKNQVLATNFTNNPQFIELGGTNFVDLTTDFQCRSLAVVGDFVVAANTFDASSGSVPDRIRWSAFNDATDWTVSPSTGADFQDLKGGPILRVFGGQYAVVCGQNSIWRMNFVGAPTWFEIQETIPGMGIVAPNAAARMGEMVYALSNQGFVAIAAGTGFEHIGAGQVDEFMKEDLDDNHLGRISAAADPASGRVYWAYPGAGNIDGEPNKIMVYDRNLDKWSLIEQETQLLWGASGVGFTLEQLDAFSSSIDNLGASLDSSQWKGEGTQSLAAFNSLNQHGFFNGSAMTGVLETKEVEIHAGQRTTLNAFKPLIDGGVVTARVGWRNDLTEEVSWGPLMTPTSTGRFTFRKNARYHRIQLNVSDDWNDAIGVQIEQEDARRCGRRG